MSKEVETPRSWGVPYAVYYTLIILIIGLAAIVALLIYNQSQENKAYLNEIKTINRNLEQLLSLETTAEDAPVTIVEITMPPQSARQAETLTEALSAMQDQYSAYMSNMSVYLTVFAIIMSFFTLGIPIFNYAFLQKDQVNILKGTEEEMQKDFKDSIDSLKEIEKNVLKNLDEKNSEFNNEIKDVKNTFDEEVQRINKAINELQKVAVKTANPEQSIDLQPISERPEDLAANYFMQSFYENDPVKKIELLDKVIEIEPDHFDAYNNRGVAYGNLKQYDQAIKNYNKAIEINPNYATAYNNRGYTYIFMKRYEKALEDIEKALSLDSDNDSILSSMAQLLTQQGRYAEAIVYFNQCLSIDIDDPYFYYDRASCYKYLSEFEKARNDCKAALALDINDHKLKEKIIQLLKELE